MNQTMYFESIPCPLCGSERRSVVYSGTFPKEITQEFLSEVYRSSSDRGLFEQVVQCDQCTLVYLNPRLKSELIIGGYAGGEDRAFIEQDAMRIRTFTTALRRLKREYRLSFSRSMKVLDIGCAGGAFLRAAEKLGLSATGIEPSKWLSQYAREEHGLDVHSGTLSNNQFPDSSFDIVTLWDVIEHLSNPESELHQIYRILKPAGLLIVNYPDFGSLPAKLLGRKWPFLLSVHLIYYTRQTMRQQLKKAGFEILDSGLHWQTLELRYVLKRAAAYFPTIRYLGRLIESIGVGSLPLTYWIGQTRVIARRYER